MVRGREAEEYVAKLLQENGWVILARNFRRIGTEIDIIANKGLTLIFVEVKERKSPPCTGRDLEELIPARKRKALQRGAACFLSSAATLPKWEESRFDLAVVSGPRRHRKLRYWAGI